MNFIYLFLDFKYFLFNYIKLKNILKIYILKNLINRTIAFKINTKLNNIQIYLQN